MRLRQIALVAGDLAGAETEIEQHLGLKVCHRDPGVAFFGLANALFCAGDTFVEVVSPTQPGTTAGRYLETNGDSGYMVIFQATPTERAAALQRAAEAGMRTVWDGAEPGIAGTHLHPKDIGGAIVSVDQADPPESWAWAGADWAAHAGPGTLHAITIATTEPEALAARWGAVLGHQPEGSLLPIDGAQLRFEDSASQSGLVAVELCAPTESGAVRSTICGVDFVSPRRP